MNMRMRFITVQTTPYLVPGQAMGTVGATYTVQSDPGGTGTGLFASTAVGAYTAA